MATRVWCDWTGRWVAMGDRCSDCGAGVHAADIAPDNAILGML